MPGTTPKTFETNWLEFKSDLWKDDEGKVNWSKVLGSFANGGGGGSVDCVQKIVLVAGVNDLVSRLKQLHPSPPRRRGSRISHTFRTKAADSIIIEKGCLKRRL